MTRPEADRLAVEAELRQYYDSEAEERSRRPLVGQRVEARRRFLREVRPSSRLLEIGTGTGRDIADFIGAGFEVVGLDLSPEQGRYAIEAGAHQVIASARHLPFRDGSFPALWSMSTLMHVPNSTIEQTLEEVRRVLAPAAIGGIGAWGGPDIEDYGDRPGDGRLFSRRSDETWRRLLETVGDVQAFETWSWDDSGDFWYQWALLRTVG